MFQSIQHARRKNRWYVAEQEIGIGKVANFQQVLQGCSLRDRQHVALNTCEITRIDALYSKQWRMVNPTNPPENWTLILSTALRHINLVTYSKSRKIKITVFFPGYYRVYCYVIIRFFRTTLSQNAIEE